MNDDEEPAWVNYVMLLVGILLVFVFVVVLTGCSATAPGVRAPAGGTALAASGEVCGAPITISLADINDREGAVLRCFDSETGNQVLELTTAGRGASDAIMAMAAANQAMAERLSALVERLAVP